MYFLTRHGVRIYVDYMNSYFNSNERTLGSYNMHTIGLNADYRFVITGGGGTKCICWGGTSS
ncbi:hypothetical protein [Helicobacter bilis]|uniref:hypothetical protein n=1 Tax=Helicobacter bilis TaxID=37372 RepID=UPI001EE7C862|nr:hypothetical protein [Helicobacter bilis]MCI7410480.1 hypothetical protein [Helicobacter bilis]